MARPKFEVGEAVEMRCLHRRDGQLAVDWLPGRVIATDYRMVAVQFDTPVYANSGLPITDRILWCTHGSPNLRRPGERRPAEVGGEVKTNG